MHAQFRCQRPSTFEPLYAKDFRDTPTVGLVSTFCPKVPFKVRILKEIVQNFGSLFKFNFPANRSTFSYSISYIFGKLMFSVNLS